MRDGAVGIPRLPECSRLPKKSPSPSMSTRRLWPPAPGGPASLFPRPPREAGKRIPRRGTQGSPEHAPGHGRGCRAPRHWHLSGRRGKAADAECAASRHRCSELPPSFAVKQGSRAPLTASRFLSPPGISPLLQSEQSGPTGQGTVLLAQSQRRRGAPLIPFPTGKVRVCALDSIRWATTATKTDSQNPFPGWSPW